ncbi:hypothetical protein C8R47DRAFT_753571 [Mycena vitilis]|nr:hypothetical protein C8R47DRAFT_753571 [Mycena vitilis]
MVRTPIESPRCRGTLVLGRNHLHSRTRTLRVHPAPMPTLLVIGQREFGAAVGRRCRGSTLVVASLTPHLHDSTRIRRCCRWRELRRPVRRPTLVLTPHTSRSHDAHRPMPMSPLLVIGPCAHPSRRAAHSVDSTRPHHLDAHPSLDIIRILASALCAHLADRLRPVYRVLRTAERAGRSSDTTRAGEIRVAGEIWNATTPMRYVSGGCLPRLGRMSGGRWSMDGCGRRAVGRWVEGEGRRRGATT